MAVGAKAAAAACIRSRTPNAYSHTLRAMSAVLFFLTACAGLGLGAYLVLCLYMYAQQGQILFPGAPHTPADGTGLLELPGTGAARVLITTDASVNAEAAGADTTNADTATKTATATATATATDNRQLPAVLYFGGNAEDAASSYPVLKKAYPRHAIYIMHYRGYTPSTGQASERTLYADAAALYAYADSRHKSIRLVGRSLGTGIACWLASQFDVEKLVLVTPYDSMVNVAARHYPYLPVRWLLRNRFESWQHAPEVTAPTLVIEAELDETIPPASTRGLLPYFVDGVATHVVVEGAMHNTLLERAEYVQLLSSV